MPWKKDEDGQIMIENENPVFVHPDGREEPLNGDSVLMRIGELKNEAKGYRQKHSELKSKVKPILDAEIEDVSDFLSRANEAMQTVESYKKKGAPSADEIEKIKKSVAESFESRMKEREKGYKKQLSELENTIKDKEKRLRSQLVRGAFDASDFISQKTNMIPETAYNTFGHRFVTEETDDGKTRVYALDSNGEKIYSLKGSSYAPPEEAIEILVKSHPQKDKLLKSNSGGSGAQGGSNAGTFTGRTIDASDYEAASKNLEKIASGEVVVTK